MDLGDALFTVGQHEEAEAAYERGVSLDPGAAASRAASRAAWQAIRLNRAQGELGLGRERSLGATLWGGVLAAVHTLKPALDLFGRTAGRRVSTVAVLLLVLLVGRGAVVLLPHYVAHHRLYDEVVRLARIPSYEDGRVREETLRAIHTYGRDPYVRPDDVRVQGRQQLRRVEFTYEVPLALLPGLLTRVPFEIRVEEPYLAEPAPVIL